MKYLDRESQLLQVGDTVTTEAGIKAKILRLYEDESIGFAEIQGPSGYPSCVRCEAIRFFSGEERPFIGRNKFGSGTIHLSGYIGPNTHYSG